MSLPPRTWLYVPGHRADRVAKAVASGADAVVLDLEDAVAAHDKVAAREGAVAALAERHPTAGDVQLWVRVNGVGTPWHDADLRALRGAGADGVRVPKAETPVSVYQIAELLEVPLQLILETARGLLTAPELAAAHPLVRGIGLGEADLAADLRVQRTGLDWARGWVVASARAAGLPSPVQSVYTDLADDEGLRRDTVQGRHAGFFGRSVIHPRQIPIVHEACSPEPDEVARARTVLAAAEAAAASGSAAVLDADGRFVDPAVVEQARVVLSLARA